MIGGKVTFADPHGNAIGEVIITRDGWNRVPVHLALRMINFQDEQGPHDLATGVMVMLYRINRQGAVEFHLGTAEDVKALEEADARRFKPIEAVALLAGRAYLNGESSLTADAEVLRG